jgi:hypothetical protein
LALALVACGGNSDTPVDAVADVGADGDIDGIGIDAYEPPTTGLSIGGVARGMREPVLVTLSAGSTVRRMLVTDDKQFTLPGRTIGNIRAISRLA